MGNKRQPVLSNDWTYSDHQKLAQLRRAAGSAEATRARRRTGLAAYFDDNLRWYAAFTLGVLIGMVFGVGLARAEEEPSWPALRIPGEDLALNAAPAPAATLCPQCGEPVAILGETITDPLDRVWERPRPRGRPIPKINGEFERLHMSSRFPWPDLDADTHAVEVELPPPSLRLTEVQP